MCVARSCVMRLVHLIEMDRKRPRDEKTAQEKDKFKTKTTPHYNTILRDSENVQNDSLTIVDIRAVQFRDRHICLHYALDRAAQSLLGSVSDSFGLVELDKFALEPCVEPRPGHFAVPPHPCVLPAGYQSDCCVCWFCRTSKASVSSSDGWLWPG